MLTRLPFAALVAFSITATFACRKAEKMPAALDTSGPVFGGSSGTGAMDGSTADSGKVVCNPLSNDATIVGERYADAILPTPLGGVVVPGTYFLTTVNVYTGMGGNTGLTGRNFQETLVLEATTFSDVRLLSDNDGGAGDPVDTNGSYAVSLTNFGLTPVCPAGGVGRNDPFTVSANTLHLYEGQNEFIYTSQ
ncbi:MAG: hypothetical protein ABIP39_15965 [Polyangiaceae bacterium]